MTNDEKYLAACAEYAALPPIETDEEKAHADALLLVIETHQGDMDVVLTAQGAALVRSAETGPV